LYERHGTIRAERLTYSVILLLGRRDVSVSCA
jgi:hypothetical protein